MLEENRQKFKYCNIPAWHKAGYTGQGKKLAVIDSNFDIDDPVFGGGIYRPMPDSRPYRSHGYYVCQVARQALPETDIFLFGRWDDALEWSLENEPEAMTASRSSISFRHDERLRQLSNKLYKKGIPLFTSAGNEGERWRLYPPGKMKEWIAVGACLMYPGNRIRMADYSAFTRDKQEEIWQMTEVVSFANIRVKVMGEDRLYSMPGTSASAPLMASLSVLFSHQKDFNREQMYKYSEPLEEEKEFCRTYGFGLFRLPEPKEVKRDVFYRVVTGSFTERGYAIHRKMHLEREGFPSFLLAFQHEGRQFFRVITGSFQMRENAERRIENLKKKGFDSFIAIYER